MYRTTPSDVGYYTAAMFNFQGVGQVMSEMDEWLEAVEESIVHEMAEVGRSAFFYVLEETPQWSGNAVANWHFNVNTASAGYDDIFKTLRDDRTGFTPFVKGSTQAMNYAYQMSLDQFGGVHSLDDVIYITNTTPYAAGLELLSFKIRSENLPGEMMHRAVERLADEAGVPIGTQYKLGV